MLLYLDARTWTGDDDRRDKLKREVLKAMSIRSVPLLLAHEDGPFEYQPATAQRHGILFDELIHGVDGGTPHRAASATGATAAAPTRGPNALGFPHVGTPS